MYSMLADEWPAAKAKLEERLHGDASPFPNPPHEEGRGEPMCALSPSTLATTCSPFYG